MDSITLITSFGTFLLGAASAGFISYITSRNKEAGKIDAIDEKLEKVVSQQKSLTIVTEKIKSDVDIKNWISKENRILRREKIELLYSKLEELYFHRGVYIFEREQENAFLFHRLVTDIKVIIELYFNHDNEFDSDLDEFFKIYEETVEIASITCEEEKEKAAILFMERYKIPHLILIKKIQGLMRDELEES
ncbi:hypothetical protein UB33_15315 [Photobacterium angustum]|uniref:hypothetical protein n=1 Tax=Photobacterium angustum TaxID=661 RepID=UPI0005E7220B|nr:hypothetical protein [Photobacterium angustum]KJG05036.1 hypothetical protein UB33_15315 [Photobacterium angustum]PSV94508.1 hypothetical protein CTN01_08325 [Photobacterium angustum]